MSELPPVEEPAVSSEPPPEPVDAGPSPEELARQEVERIVEAGRTEAEELRRTGREQGYADGLKEGMEQGKATGRDEGLAELRGALDRWLTMGDALTAAWRTRFEGLEDEIRELSLAIGEKLVLAHLAAAPDAVIGIVRDALRHAAEAGQVTVIVNPRDAALVRSAQEDLGALLKGAGRFEIIEDEKVEQGACIVETKTQVIDATRKTRTDNLRDTMRGGGGGTS
jgi:flagellar assembly protein FliH